MWFGYWFCECGCSGFWFMLKGEWFYVMSCKLFVVFDEFGMVVWYMDC